MKGKVSRSLASKCALCVRVDALGENTNGTIGTKCRKVIESRIAALEGGNASKSLKKGKSGIEKYDSSEGKKKGVYNTSNEVVLNKKKKREENDDDEDDEKEVKTKAKKKVEVESDDDDEEEEEIPAKKSKKKKHIDKEDEDESD
jgi:nucleolar protein 58